MRCQGKDNGTVIPILPPAIGVVPMDSLHFIVSNKGSEGEVGDAMVVCAGVINVTWFKGPIEIKEGPRAVRSFTF